MSTTVLRDAERRGAVPLARYIRRMLRVGLVLFVISATSAVVAVSLGGCGSGSECDECSKDGDCDSDQTCSLTTLGNRCVKKGENSCEIKLL